MLPIPDGFRFRGRRLCGFILCFVVVACSQPDAPTARNAPRVMQPFASTFAEVGHVELEQSDSIVLGMIIGLAIDSKGHFVVGDATEADLKVYDQTGAFIARMSRQGEGPGEVSTAAIPTAAPNGEIHATIFARNQVLIFTNDYAFARSVSFDSVNALASSVLTAEGTYLSVGLNTIGTAVLESDVTGKFLAWRSVSDSIPVRNQRESPLWTAFSTYGAVRVGDSTFVTNTLSDSLWTFVGGSAAPVRARSLEFPGYRAPMLPSREMFSAPGGPLAFMDVAHAPRTLGGGLIVPFGRGRYLESDSNVVAVIVGDSVVTYSQAPPILLTAGDTIVALDPVRYADGRVVLRMFLRRL